MDACETYQDKGLGVLFDLAVFQIALASGYSLFPVLS